MLLVDWNEILDGYNRIYHTDFETAKDMVGSVYKAKKTLVKTGDVFGLSGQTIHKYMRQWSLKTLPSGHRSPSPCLRSIHKLGDVSGLSCAQIAEAIEFSEGQVCALLRKHKIKYRRLRRENGTHDRQSNQDDRRAN